MPLRDDKFSKNQTTWSKSMTFFSLASGFDIADTCKVSMLQPSKAPDMFNNFEKKGKCLMWGIIKNNEWLWECHMKEKKGYVFFCKILQNSPIYRAEGWR